MNVAFATSQGAAVDLDFKSAVSFSLWDIQVDGAFYVQSISIGDDADNEEDRILRRANALAGCTILCVRDINGPATAKLVSRHIHPIKTVIPTPVEELIARLQGVLRLNPAPWLRKACNLDRCPERSCHLLDAPVADLLARYPDARPLVMGSGFSLFPDEGAMDRGGIFGTIRDALHCRGISEDLFAMLLTREIAPAAEVTP